MKRWYCFDCGEDYPCVLEFEENRLPPLVCILDGGVCGWKLHPEDRIDD